MFAITKARAQGAELIVANVSRVDSFVDNNLAENDQTQALAKGLKQSGVEHQIVQHIGRGHATEITQIAADRGTDLIVIGLRRRSTVGKLLLGSTAQSILLHAGCSVLMNPMEDTQWII